MPEPVLVIVGGMALYSWLKGRAQTSPTPAAIAAAPASATAGQQPLSDAAAGTGPDAPLATNTSVVNAGVAPLATAEYAGAIPSDLVAALDNDTALKMRAYAALNPDDFQAFLDTYADRIVLRNDMYFEAINNPPEAGYQLTPGMVAGLGNAAYKVGQALNGVAVGRSVDIFGVSASVAGQIPGLNQDFVTSLQAAALGYRAITTLTDVMALAVANNVSVLNFTAMTAAGAYPGLASLSMANALGPVLMAAGLVIDIGFTIIGDKPDLQKAVDVALDVAALAFLFIPVIGVFIAIVIQLVKFIIDLFGEDLFGGGLSHEEREVLEAAKYGELLNPMFGELADSYTPRELFQTIVRWGSGYCGGRNVVAMGVNLVLKAGDTLSVGGQPVTIQADTLLGFGDNEQASGCYWLKAPYNNGLFANITNDEQAIALAVYAPVNGIIAGAQVGIAEWRQVQFEDPTQKLIQARTIPMREFIVKHHLSLDQIDMIAAEYRAQPHLNVLASSYGFDNWQMLFAYVVAREWEAFTWSTANGTLADFARMNGYPTMYAFRAGALATWESYFARVERASATLYQNALQAQSAMVAEQMYAQQQMNMSAP